MALDASNTGSLFKRSDELPSGAMRYFFNGTDNDSATAKEMVAAPGVGRKLIITHLSINSSAAQAIAVLNGGTTALIGPIQLEASGASYSKDYEWGIELTANTAMYVDSDSDVLFHIYVEYINAPG